MNENITIDYIIDDDELPCLYINRLKDSLDKEDCNISILEKKLESIIEDEVKDINKIIDKLEKNKKILYGNNNNLKNIFKVSMELSRDFENYGKKVLMYNQINTIKLYGLDEDKIINIKDFIHDHKTLLKSEIDKLGKLYKIFLDEANNIYNRLDDNDKNNIINSISRYLYTKNINKDNTNEIIQENNLLDIIFGISGGIISLTLSFIKKFWVAIVGILGLNYLTNNFIFKIISNLIPNVINTINNFIIISAIFLGCCLSIKIYHVYYDYKYSKENKVLSDKLDEINKEVRSNKTSNNINYLNKNKDNTFRGFNNKASYNPNGDGNKDPRAEVF